MPASAASGHDTSLSKVALGGAPRPPHVDVEAVGAALATGTIVVDARPAANHRAGHIPGTLNIPLGRSFTTWAGWLVPSDRDVVLIADGDAAAAAVRDLMMIGLDRVVGVAPGQVVQEWARGDGREFPGLQRPPAARPLLHHRARCHADHASEAANRPQFNPRSR